MFIYYDIDGDDSGVLPTDPPGSELEHHENGNSTDATIKDVRKALVSTGGGDKAKKDQDDIPCELDSGGLKSLNPSGPVAPVQLSLSFVDAIDRVDSDEIPKYDGVQEPDTADKEGEKFVHDANGTISDDGVVNGSPQVENRDGFGNISFVGDPKPLSLEEIEERRMRVRIYSAFDKETLETRMLVGRVRRLLATGDEVKALRILEEELRFVAKLRYNHEHQQGTHEFSEVTDDYTEFAKFFIREAGIGKTSTVLDMGCGFLRDTIAFAKEGAKVTAVDASSYAIESGNRFIAGKPYADKITTLNDDFIQFLYTASPGSFTHIHTCSSSHYRPPTILMRDLRRMHTILSPNGGYLCMAIKTNQSDSRAKQVPLTMGPYHCGIDPRDRIFRIYPEKLAIDDMVRGAGFTIQEAFTSRNNGYDVKGEVEVFRVIIAKAEKEMMKIISR